MKEKITMLTIAVVIILMLSWAVVAMAGSYNMTISSVQGDGVAHTTGVQMDTDMSKLEIDSSRTDLIPPGTEVAEINR